MKRFILIGCVLALGVSALQGQMRQDKTRIQDNDEEGLQRTEMKWLEAVFAPDAGMLEGVLAADFTAGTSGGGVFDKAAFIAATQRIAATYADINLDDRRVRLYGDTAVSTGRATLVPRAAASNAAAPEIKVAQSVPVKSSVANMTEIAREEAANPPKQTGQPMAVHAPMPMPDEWLVKQATARQYRYTAVYIRRPRDWQVVALQLTLVAEH